MENWRDVPGSEGKYQIDISTKEGRCRVIYKNGEIRDLNHTVRNKRIFWCLTIGGREIFAQAAKWIAITYPELIQNEYFDGAEICHMDNDALNNHPSNLRWGTHKYNMNNIHTRNHHSEVIMGNHFHLGKKHSDAAKEKMRMAKLGTHLTEEHKKNLSESLTNHPSISVPVNQYTMDGEFVASYPSMAEIVRRNPDKKLSKGNITLCCQGVRKSHAGYKWEYAR